LALYLAAGRLASELWISKRPSAVHKYHVHLRRRFLKWVSKTAKWSAIATIKPSGGLPLICLAIWPQVQAVARFIDGANLYATAKTFGFDIDYKRLLQEFQGRTTLLRAFYYTAVIEDQEYSPIRPLIDWLDYNGYTVVTEATKEFVDAYGRRKVNGNTDIELAVDTMELAEHVD
jgi:hypothetical protein